MELVREDLQKIAPDQTFEVTAAGDTLILTGTVSDNVVQTRLLEGARPYAKGVVNLLKVQKLEQVLLQVRVSEVDRSITKELGFNFQFEGKFLPGGGDPAEQLQLLHRGRKRIGPGVTFSDLMNVWVAKPGSFPHFTVFLRVLHDKGGLKTLAEPNLVVANGSGGNSWWGGSSPSSSARRRGWDLSHRRLQGVRRQAQFRAQDFPERRDLLQVSQEVSELDFANAVILSGFRIPALKSRKAESGLQLADGQTFVLAGLLDNKVQKQVSKIPLLGDIPILGALFRSTRYSNNETELMVMVTPKIVRPLNKDEIPALPPETMKPEETSPDMIW